MLSALEGIEQSGVFTNNGAVVRRFEAEATERLFGGAGGCVTVANATLGLMLALRQSAMRASAGAKLALMPSFTFAATAQAALWAGLTPLLCDIDPLAWLPCAKSEEAKLRQYAGRIAAIVPYATFGNSLDLDRYAWLSARYGVDVVVDAAASLGSQDASGRGFGTGSRVVSVFSMHATKTFATAEGGLIYSADTERLAMLRTMASFGFGEPRSATMPGLNAKMSEVNALLASAKLGEIDAIVERRSMLASRYETGLPGMGFQQKRGRRQALQAMPVLLPRHLASARPAILAGLAANGIGAGKYFSPHLAEQPYFHKTCIGGRLRVTADIASRVIALPLADDMSLDEVDIVCETLAELCDIHAAPPRALLRDRDPASWALAL